MLYYVMLYYVMLYYVMLYYFILYYIILYYIILYYIILFYIILFYIILFYFIFYYFIFYYFILYYIILYYIIRTCPRLRPSWLSADPPGIRSRACLHSGQKRLQGAGVLRERAIKGKALECVCVGVPEIKVCRSVCLWCSLGMWVCIRHAWGE